MFLKSHLEIKCHSQYINVVRFLQYINCNSNACRGLHNRYESGVICITEKHILQNEKKLRDVQEEQLRAWHTSLRHYWHNVNQFTPTTVHHNVLWSWGEIGESLESPETIPRQRNSQNTTPRLGARTSADQCHHKGPTLRRDVYLHSTWRESW